MKTAILITSTVNPNGMINLNLSNPGERLEQYIKSVNFYIDNTDFDVIVCDNSNYDYSEKLDKSNKVEFLSFDGNHVKNRGKGYGECEIIKYALENSSIIEKMNEHDRLIVITGRIIINNLKNLNYFYHEPQEINLFKWQDKIISVVSFGSLLFWKQFSNNGLIEVSDSNWHNFFESIIVKNAENCKGHTLRYFDRIFPEVMGISGTVNAKYKDVFNLPDNPDCNIFICTHKEFNVPDNRVYIPIADKPLDGMLDASVDDNVAYKDDKYSELIQIYWLWKNYQLPKYIGLSHYRKYFSFMNEIPDMKEIFNEHDIIVSRFTDGKPLFASYSYYHNIEDLMSAYKIIEECYPQSSNDFKKYLNQDILFPCNMFVMKKENFIKYCEFLFPIIKKIDAQYHLELPLDYEKHVTNDKEKYIKNFYPNNTVEYQSRFVGFLAERISSFYFSRFFTNPLIYNLNIIEDKYGKKN
jgi:hypothetical protein